MRQRIEAPSHALALALLSLVFGRANALLAADGAGYRPLARIPQATVALTPGVTAETGGSVIETVKSDDRGNIAALETKLTLLDSQGERILPAYFSDNYISLLPGEVKEITAQCHSYPGIGVPQFSLRGWNVPTKIVIGYGKK